MKKIVFFICLSLVIICFSGCIRDDNDCFRVTYSLNASDAEGTAPVDVNIYARNATVVVLGTDAVRPGFTFTGWNTRVNGSGDTYLPGETFAITADVAFYAQWEEVPVITFDVVYNANGGVGGPFTDIVLIGQPYTVLTSEESGISRADFIFTGWNTAADGSGISYPPGTEITVEENLTLYAIWTPIIQVTFVANGGIGGPVVFTVQYGTVIYPTPEQLGISRAGYVLVAWNTQPDGSGIPYAGPLVATENITLYAVWIPEETFDVTLLPNGGTGTPHTDNVPSSAVYTIPSGDQLGFSRPGFTFVNWNTQPDGTGTAYSSGMDITVTEALTLYAQWAPIEVGITFDPNGATGTAYTYYVPLNSSFTLPTTEQLGFSRPNYIFFGWNTQPTGAGTSYQPGASIEVVGNLTLYARWLIPI